MRALFDRYPRIATRLARVDLQVSTTPVERWTVDGVTLSMKRDDLSAPALGGNKVRALELLLAGAGPAHVLLTVGSAGSTHALSVARHGAQLGARIEVITWPQEMNAVAHATSRALSRVAVVTRARSVADAYLRAALRRLRHRRWWIPAGGSVPMGALGHVNAALELAAQVAQGIVPVPDVIIAPLGSGGTVAGLLVGLSLAGLRTRVVGVRVVPRVVANRRRIARLATRTHALVRTLAADAIPPLDLSRFAIDDEAFGGAYGRETPAARDASAALLAAGGPPLDATYSAKAFAVALALARGVPRQEVLFWLTFDARWLDDSEPSSRDSTPRLPRPVP